jgi:hypothetical protein
MGLTLRPTATVLIHKPPTIHDTHARVQESNLHARILAALFRSIRECRNGREMDPPPPTNEPHFFFFFIYCRSANERGIFTNEFLTIFELFL